MKILLACLMCLVLCTSECFALKGGPPYPGGQVRTTGNYAGLFAPTGTDNSLGIFTVTVPITGQGRGVVAFFRNGIFYPGTIQALVDPDSAVMTAIVNSSFNVTFAETIDTRFVVTFNANGSINASIRANSVAFSTAASRIRGTAGITYDTVGGAPGFDLSRANSNGPVPYVVSGFKQSEVSQ